MTYEATSSDRRTITAFFDSRTNAEEAVEELAAAGIARGDIRLVAGNEGGQTTSTYSRDNEVGFWDALKDLFLPDEDRHTYAEGLQRGGYLVTVTTSAMNYDTALDILDDEGTIDINERESSWRAEGWTGYTGASSLGETSSMTGMSGGMSTARAGNVSSEEVIPVVEEELQVGKRDVSHGRVRVRSYVVETPVSEQVSLREENVSIQRRPVDRALSGSEASFQDRTIEMEERSEEAVVAKDSRVREELVISKDVNQRTETVSDTVRRTEVDIEDDRKAGTSGTKRTDF